MKISFVIAFIFFGLNLQAQSFLQVKTPELYYVVGSIDSVDIHDIVRNENELLYVECNGVKKIIFCGYCGATYVYDKIWLFSMPISKNKPKDMTIKLGIMDMEGYKISEDTYTLDKKVYHTKYKNPLKLLFADI